MSDVKEAVETVQAVQTAPAPSPPVTIPQSAAEAPAAPEQMQQPDDVQEPGAENEGEGEGEGEVEGEGEKTLLDVDQELEAMKRKLQQMEAESLSLQPGETGNHEMKEVGPPSSTPTTAPSVAPSSLPSDETITDADARSIYVGNVDYNATVDELSAYFSECGTINRVTIMTHRPTGQPKGFAYVEFKDQHAVQNAMILNESLFKGRQLKIVPKRTNIPGLARGRGRGRGKGRGYGRRGRGRGRGRWVPY